MHNKARKKVQVMNFRIFSISRDETVCMERCLPCIIDVNNFVLCGFGVWMLPYSTLRRGTLIHFRFPNPAEHTKDDYEVPPTCVGLLYILCMLIIHASSDCHPPNQTHQMVTPITHSQTTNT